MNSGSFWLLVVPTLLVAAAYYLAFLGAGLGLLVAAYRATRTGRRRIFLALGLGVMAAPFALDAGQRMVAEHEASARQVQLARMERVDLSGRLPKTFVTVGNFREADIAFLKSAYGLRQPPPEEAARLASVYGEYRSAEFCQAHFAGKMISPKVKIPVCREVPGPLPEALSLKAPVLFLVEGFATSYRRSNTRVGEMYEVRLVTPTEDLLVDYFEEKTIDLPASPLHPFRSGQERAAGSEAPTLREFIQSALDGASR